MIDYGMFKRQTGEHYECVNESEALRSWVYAPKTEGTWVLMVNGIETLEVNIGDAPTNKMNEAAADMLAALELLLHGDGRPNETLRIMALARIAVAKARHA